MKICRPGRSLCLLYNRFFRHQACYSLLPAKPGGQADRVISLCKYKVVDGKSSKFFCTTVLCLTYCTCIHGMGHWALVLISTPVIQLLINNDKKSQFHTKELFLQGISSMAEIIPPKESVPRNRVSRTMHVSRYSLCCPRPGGDSHHSPDMYSDFV